MQGSSAFSMLNSLLKQSVSVLCMTPEAVFSSVYTVAAGIGPSRWQRLSTKLIRATDSRDWPESSICDPALMEKPGVRLPAAAKTSMFCKSVTTAVVLKAKMGGIMHVCGRLMWPKPRRQKSMRWGATSAASGIFQPQYHEVDSHLPSLTNNITNSYCCRMS